MNTMIVAGNLTRDAEQRAMPDGTPVLNFAVADNSSSAAPTIFWDCAIYGKYAITMSELLFKGSPVTVVGNVLYREWTSKDGTPQKRAEIRVSNVTLQGSKGQPNNTAYAAPRPVQAPQHMPQRKPPAPSSGFDDMDDDLPF